MEEFCFETGTLVAPNIPSGRRIDSKLLLKSIAPSRCIYIRLLAELSDESDDIRFLFHFLFQLGWKISGQMMHLHSLSCLALYSLTCFGNII